MCPTGNRRKQYLEHLTWEGAEDRWPDGIPDKVLKQLRHELALIERLDFARYFLTVHDIVAFARSLDPPILCQGRGSAANSAVCYCLGITAVDPALNDLLFERFISERGARRSSRSELVDVVLAHSMKVRSVHRALPIGTVSVAAALGQDEAADVLREVARHARPAARRAFRSASNAGREIERRHHRRGRPRARPPYGPRWSRRAAVRLRISPSTLPTSRIAERGRNGSRSPRFPPARAVLLIDVLDHFLAPLMFESTSMSGGSRRSWK